MKSITVWEALCFVFVLMLVQKKKGEFTVKVLLGVEGGLWNKNMTSERVHWWVLFFSLSHELSNHIWKRYYFLLIKLCRIWLRVTIGWKCQLFFVPSTCSLFFNLTTGDLANQNSLSRKISIEITKLNLWRKKEFSYQFQFLKYNLSLQQNDNLLISMSGHGSQAVLKIVLFSSFYFSSSYLIFYVHVLS